MELKYCDIILGFQSGFSLCAKARTYDKSMIGGDIVVLSKKGHTVRKMRRKKDTFPFAIFRSYITKEEFYNKLILHYKNEPLGAVCLRARG